MGVLHMPISLHKEHSEGHVTSDHEKNKLFQFTNFTLKLQFSIVFCMVLQGFFVFKLCKSCNLHQLKKIDCFNVLHMLLNLHKKRSNGHITATHEKNKPF